MSLKHIGAGYHSCASRPSRMGLAALVGSALICAGALAPDASARPGLSCSNLKGKRVVSTRRVRVVVQRSESKGVAYVCAPPNGRVRIAGQTSGLTSGFEFAVSVATTAGSWVALHFDSAQGVAGEEVGKAFNASNGKSYRYWYYLTSPTAKPEEVRFLDRVLLDPFGDVALAEHQGDTERIVAFAPNGKRHVLDSGARARIPSGSLTLSGRKVQWLDGGVTRRASV